MFRFGRDANGCVGIQEMSMEDEAIVVVVRVRESKQRIWQTQTRLAGRAEMG